MLHLRHHNSLDNNLNNSLNNSLNNNLTDSFFFPDISIALLSKAASFIVLSFLLFALLTISACTQPQTTVELRGHENFSRNGKMQYARSLSSQNKAMSGTVASANSANSSSSFSNLEPASGGRSNSSNSINSSNISVADNAADNGADNSSSFGFGQISVSDLKDEKIAESKAQNEVNYDEQATDEKAAEKSTEKSAEKSTDSGASRWSKEALIWPLSSRNIINKFGDTGNNGNKSNEGINIAAAEGEPVWAVADGEAVYVDNKLKFYGKMIILKHSGGKTTTYAHLARYAVEKYDRVKQGDIIGYVGSSGNVKEPQLYFSLRKGGKAVDPLINLDRKLAKN